MKYDEKINPGKNPGLRAQAKNQGAAPIGSSGKNQQETGSGAQPEKPPGGLDLGLQLHPLIATVLLGLCELIFIGASANYLSMQSIGVGILFFSISFLIAAASVAILAWGVLKRLRNGRGNSAECIKAGITLGICASVAVCALAGLFSIVGMGPDRLNQKFSEEMDEWQTVALYLEMFVVISAVYFFAGASAGVLARLIVKMQPQVGAQQSTASGIAANRKGKAASKQGKHTSLDSKF